MSLHRRDKARDRAARGVDGVAYVTCSPRRRDRGEQSQPRRRVRDPISSSGTDCRRRTAVGVGSARANQPRCHLEARLRGDQKTTHKLHELVALIRREGSQNFGELEAVRGQNGLVVVRRHLSAHLVLDDGCERGRADLDRLTRGGYDVIPQVGNLKPPRPSSRRCRQ